MTTIYTIGDSHSKCGWEKIPNVVPNCVGPVLMYSFGLKKTIYTTNIPNDSIICFSFGEIDCRCHVYLVQPWRETIDRLVNNYAEVIKLNMQGKGETWIYNVLPPCRNTTVIRNSQFPFRGTDDERLMYTTYMNDKLRTLPYTFVDVYDKYADKDGFMNPEHSIHGIHVRNYKFLQDWVESHR